MRTLACTIVMGMLIASAVFGGDAAEHPIVVSDAKTNGDGIRVHEATSPYQRGTTLIRVLLPEPLDREARYPVIYVLPVEAGVESRYGDGLLEARRLGLHNKHRAIFVAPTFSHLPWYADHPANSDCRQETYFTKVVVPFIDKSYPARQEAGGRLLLGFSKSGWGAFSLLLRHPEVFGKAAAWDAPMTKDRPDQYGMDGIFGTQANFEAYRITTLLERQADRLRGGRRLILTGYGNFRGHHQTLHALMLKLQIDHDYRDGPARKHEWGSGWMEESVELLQPLEAAH